MRRPVSVRSVLLLPLVVEWSSSEPPLPLPYQTRAVFYESKRENAGETAFQRALKSHPNGRLVRDGSQTKVNWLGIELPIIFSTNPRRTSVDLIGRTEIHGTFLCELKYSQTEQQAPAGNRVDYAIFEGLLYYAIISRDHALLEGKVYRPPKPLFSWKDVSDSRAILVLANDLFWTRARSGKDIERITSLVTEIRKTLDIEVLLCSAPDYKFKLEGVAGEYEPQLVPCAEEIPDTAKAFPTYRFFD